MHVYFSGIGGVGIGPLASIALDMGFTISGSDLADSLVLRELRARGAAVALEQSGEHLQAEHTDQPFDYFVYTAALPADHPELLLAGSLGIRTMKRDEFLSEIITKRNLKLIAVAGTHGKTTTTGMMVWTMKQLGVPVSYSIGSTVQFGKSGEFDPASDYFVYECDEFDRNFLKFEPELSLITSIDYDHPDTYPTEQDYTAAFNQFIAQSGQVIMWQPDADYIGSSAENTVVLPDDPESELSLAGAHNRRNGRLVLEALTRLGIGEPTANQRALEAFVGTDRRFEKLGDNLYSDYGHHPVEISATLQLARELSDHVVLVYQPHQNVRQHEIKATYRDDVFAGANDLYWLSTYLSREDPNLEILIPETLTSALTHVTIADLNDELWDTIQRHRDAGHLVLCMGAGSIDEWARSREAVKKVASLLLITDDNTIAMQKRDDNPAIVHPGMITGFGGAVEAQETIRQAAARELREETNVAFKADDLAYFTTFHQILPTDGSSRYVSFFTYQIDDTAQLEVYEGAGFEIITKENFSSKPLSPTAMQAVEAYYALSS